MMGRPRRVRLFRGFFSFLPFDLRPPLAVILGAPRRIAQHLVCFVNILHPARGFHRRVDIGMVLARQPSKCRFDHFLLSGKINLENLIIVFRV
jgi:hypothetical protein